MLAFANVGLCTWICGGGKICASEAPGPEESGALWLSYDFPSLQIFPATFSGHISALFPDFRFFLAVYVFQMFPATARKFPGVPRSIVPHEGMLIYGIPGPPSALKRKIAKSSIPGGLTVITRALDLDGPWISRDLHDLRRLQFPLRIHQTLLYIR